MSIKNSQQLSVILTAEQLRDFSNYVKEVTDSDISELPTEKLVKLYDDFEIGELSNELCNKVSAEYTEFIENMKKQSAEYLIEAAYEIVWKDNIAQFVENESPMLSKRQYVALLSATNTLNEVYDEWLSNGDLHTYDDIAITLEDTAGKLLVSLEREVDE
ncbi:MAG: DUF3848 domain-containing protein [Eubacterium sp.]|nr:DUF3848 domain-containing protein [Eubacterium sp.]